MSRSNHPLIRKQSLTFAALTVFGITALLLGLGLIIFAHYHERAYVFLILGAGCFISGVTGIVTIGSKVRVSLSYGVISVGMMSIIVGLNYLIDRYGGDSKQAYGYIVIALSIITILAGISGALIAQPKGGFTAFSSMIMQGVIASLGIVALTVGTIYLVVFQSYRHAYLMLGIGAGCLLCGIAYGIFAHNKVGRTSLH